MKTKKINYENGISYYLTSSTKSYTVLAEEIESILYKKLGNKADITSRRVKEWAHGTLPQGVELDAICLHKFDDKSKWRDLYFPSTDFTLAFIKYISIEQVNKVLRSSQIETFIKKTRSSIYL